MTNDHKVAARVWEIVDEVRAEAADLRKRAAQLDAKAERLNELAAALSDGRPIADVLAP